MKMATKESEQVGPTQVTTKDPKKVEQGKKLAEYNRKKKEELKEQKKNEQESENSENSAVNLTSNQCCYGIGAIVVGGAIIIIGYQVWKSKKKEVESFTHNPVIHNPHNPTTQQPQNQLRKLEME